MPRLKPYTRPTTEPAPTSPAVPQMLTVRQAAERLGLTEWALRGRIARGSLAGCVVRLGRTVLIREDRLAATLGIDTAAAA